jgi:hypothetical protein
MKQEQHDRSPRTQREERKKRTRRMTVCAMAVALGCVILMLGSLLDVLDLCTAALVALLGVVIKIEYGRGYPWGVYLATALLALLLTPQKGAALVYAAVGYYPILKAYIERLPRAISATVKMLLFITLEMGLITLTDVITGADEIMPPLYYVGLYLLGMLTLWLYDLLITRLVTRYLVQWRWRVQRWF